MTHPQQPWQKLRNLEPPLCSQERVIAKALQQSDVAHCISATTTTRVRLWRPWWPLPLLAAAAIAVFWIRSDEPNRTTAVQDIEAGETESLSVQHRAARIEPTVPALPVVKTEPKPVPPATSEISNGPPLAVAKDDLLAIDLPEAKLKVVGPAVVQTNSKGVILRAGRVRVAGYASITGPQCAIWVHGTATANVVDQHLDIRVRKGRAESTHPNCTVTYTPEHPSYIAPPKPNTPQRHATAPKRSQVQRNAAPLVTVESPTPPTNVELSPRDSSLRQQLEQYKQVRKLGQTETAVVAIQRFVKRWPNSPLRQESEATEIEILVHLQRKTEAKTKLRAFQKRYPNSIKTLHLRALLH